MFLISIATTRSCEGGKIAPNGARPFYPDAPSHHGAAIESLTIGPAVPAAAAVCEPNLPERPVGGRFDDMEARIDPR
jgi:hypothetical protein